MSSPLVSRTQIFSAREHGHLTAWLAGLHGECITSDKMTGSFMSPLSIEKMLKWWKDRMAETATGNRVIIMLLENSDPDARVEHQQLIGVIMLAIPYIETSPFRATVESLLVSSKSRQKGGATILLRDAEEQAKLKGKTLLMAEMESETPAAALFMKHGYREAGRVPGYSLRPDNGDLRETVFLYKDITH